MCRLPEVPSLLGCFGLSIFARGVLDIFRDPGSGLFVVFFFGFGGGQRPVGGHFFGGTW